MPAKLPSDKVTLAVAWGITISSTVATDIVVGGQNNSLLRWIVFVAVLSAALLPFIWSNAKQLRMYAGMLVLLQLIVVSLWNGFGPWASAQLWFPTDPAMQSFVLLMPRVLAAILSMVLLAFCGYKREQYFLTVGESLPRWIAPATGLALIFALTMFVYLQDRSIAVAIVRRGVLMPALLASMNAFAEEVLYRAILLAPILKILSVQQSVLLTAVVFGIAHYYGTPSGLPGVILTTFAGGVFGYAMVGTRGLFVPWLLHLVPDVVIMLMA